MRLKRFVARLARIVLVLIGLVATFGATAAGLIDGNFAGGVARVSGQSAQGPGAVLVRPDGRLIYAARRFNGSAVIIGARKVNGAVDNIFNGGGFGMLTSTGAVYGPRLANHPVLTDRFMIGYTDYRGGAYHVVLCRLYDGGAIDQTFTINGYAGQTGCVSTEAPVGAPNGLILAGFEVWANGTIVLGGTAYNYSASAIGKPFEGFLSTSNNLSYSILPAPGDYVINAFASVEGTDIRYFGGTVVTQPGDFAGVVVRSTTTTSLQATFNINLAPSGIDDVRALIRTTNGKLFAVATVDASSTVTTCAMFSMSQSDLSPDASFGPLNNGRRYLHFGAVSDSARCDALVADRDNRLYVGGLLNISGIDVMAVARLSSTGELDAGYGSGGVSLFGTRGGTGPAYDERVAALAIQDGRAIAVGPSGPDVTATPATTDMTLVRLTDDDHLFAGDFE